MSEFIKLGNKIINKPDGLDCDLKSGTLYNLKYDNWNGTTYLEEDGSFNLPDKIYLTDEDRSFINRVLIYHEHSIKQSTGVMLEGVKGTGKTVMAKLIAKDSNLPIIIVNPEYPTAKLNDFFTKFITPIVVIFDEVDKNWDTDKLLTWLDGIQSTAKKLVLFTCNDANAVSKYLKDRCSRVRYSRHFESNDNARFLKDIIADKGIEDIEDTYKFIVNTFKLLSIDNINSFLDEKILFPELTNSRILLDMNIENRLVTSSINDALKEDSGEDCEESEESFTDIRAKLLSL